MYTQNYRDIIKAITEIRKERDSVFVDCKLHGRKGPQVSQQILGSPVSMKPGLGLKVQTDLKMHTEMQDIGFLSCCSCNMGQPDGY